MTKTTEWMLLLGMAALLYAVSKSDDAPMGGVLELGFGLACNVRAGWLLWQSRRGDRSGA